MPAGVSVVIPTHKRPELMKLAVESVNAQTWEGTMEIIVVFDACPIELPDVELRPGRSIVGISNTRTRGLAGARNSGIMASTQELVGFLDDDDTWVPEKLTKQLRLIEQAPDAILVGTAMEIFDGTNRIVRLVDDDVLTHDDFLRSRQPGLPSGGILVRRELLLGDLGLLDEELPRGYAEDYDFLLRASALGPVHVVNEPLVVVLWNGQSYYFGQWEDYATALTYLLRKHPDFGNDPRWIARIEAQIAFALASCGRRQEARTWANRALKHDLRQPKAVLALLISWRLLTTKAVTSVVRRMGRGI